jgi:hypothetical protein
VKLCIDDDERTALALKGIVRKRLTYRCLTTEWPHGKSKRNAKEAPEKD